jgi:hypothetical protein
MRSRHSPWIIVAVVALLAAGSATAAGNQPPTAAAGLDQTVTSGTTVYLDAGNSDDPDGSVASVSWSIRAPNGSEVTPSCVSCTAPTFTPDTTGRWTATVTVTDDDGATATDTLYVTVEAPRGPDLSVTAPETAVEGQSTAFTVDTDADDADLRAIALYHDGTRVDQQDVGGQRTSTELSHTFDDAGTTELRATVTDEDGYVNTTTVSVDVVELGALSVSGFDGRGGSVPPCDDPAAERVYRNGEPGSMCSASDMIYDTQDSGTVVALRGAATESGIRLYSSLTGQVERMTTGEQAEQLQREAGNQAIPIERVKEVFRRNIRRERNKKYSEIKESVSLDNSKKSNYGSANNRGDTDNQLEHSVINKQKESIENYRPSQTGHPSSDGLDIESDEKTSSVNEGDRKGIDDASTSDGESCPPLRANVPSSVRNQYC